MAKSLTLLELTSRSYFFSILGSSVKIYSVTTGQVLSTLYAPARETTTVSDTSLPDDITSATLNPHNAYQLITGSLNGYIMVWDFLDGVLLQTIDIGQPIFHICAHEKFKDFVFVGASRRIHGAFSLATHTGASILTVPVYATIYRRKYYRSSHFSQTQ
jgi:WD40 repeat protein